MRERQETYFIAAGRKVDSTCERSVKYSRELLRVACRNVFNASNYFVSFRVQPEERSFARHLNGQTFLLNDCVQSLAESRSAFIEHLERVDALNLLQCCQPGTHADRV